MTQTSQQQDLVEAEKLRMEEEYFDKMGLKEQLEEKMMNTFKIDCKAVKCLQVSLTFLRIYHIDGVVGRALFYFSF